ncbi:MAG TPA: hypothetical protein VF861_13910 [Telluria sp.]
MTSASLAGVRQLPTWLKNCLLAGLLITGCWVAAICYWLATDSTPASGELMLSLLALPAALLLALGIGRKVFAKRAAAPVASAQAETGQASPGLPSSPPLAIVASAVRSPHGSSAEELSATIAVNKARADLDPELLDEEGYPVMTARSTDATDEVLQEEITEWLAANGMAGLCFTDEQWRALTMATGVAGELASHAANQLISRDAPAPMLQLIPLLPAGWGVDQRRAAGRWIEHTVTRFGWPAASLALARDAQTAAAHGSPSSLLGNLAQRAEPAGKPLVAMLVACASNISEQSVAEWAASAALFTSSQPQGLIPGEGAAGLLLTDLRFAQSIAEAPFALLAPFHEARRDASADETRRTPSALLAELVQTALQRDAAELAATMIVADTGHRASRVLELMGVASSALPELDADVDIVRVGASSGTCDAVPFVTALALARHHALERLAPVLFISNEDPFHRCAAVIRPAPQHLT